MQRPTVVLADDYPGILALLQALLEPAYQVVEAVMDGESLVRAAAEHRPDFIIADIDMPRMSGLKAARQIVRLVPDCTLLFHTSHDDPSMRAEAFAAGAAAYVVKGQPAQLLACLRDAAEKPRAPHSQIHASPAPLCHGADTQHEGGRPNTQRIVVGH